MDTYADTRTTCETQLLHTLPRQSAMEENMKKMSDIKQAFIIFNDIIFIQSRVDSLDDSFGLHDWSKMVFVPCQLADWVGCKVWAGLSLLHMVSDPSRSSPALLNMAISWHKRAVRDRQRPKGQVIANSYWSKQVQTPSDSMWEGTIKGHRQKKKDNLSNIYTNSQIDYIY